MTLEVTETIDRDEWDAREYANYGVRAEVAHHAENGKGDTNKHAIILGETVILVEGTVSD